MCKLIDKRKCNSLCVKHTFLRMLATAQDTEYFSKQRLYLNKGVDFTTVLKLHKLSNLGIYFGNVNNKRLRKIKAMWIGRI